jgi:hypothetical protein
LPYFKTLFPKWSSFLTTVESSHCAVHSGGLTGGQVDKFLFSGIYSWGKEAVQIRMRISNDPLHISAARRRWGTGVFRTSSSVNTCVCVCE